MPTAVSTYASSSSERNTSGYLLDLVKSLSKAEKRYFKLFVKGKASQNDVQYIRLFDTLVDLKTADEKRLLNALPNVSSNQLPKVKKRLYDQLMLCLQAFHRDHDDEAKITSLLQNATILFKKGLYSQSHKSLSKAEQLAKATHHYFLLGRIYEWQRKLAQKLTNTHNDLHLKVGEKLAHEQQVFENLNLQETLESFRHRIYSIFSVEGRIGRREGIQKEMTGLLHAMERSIPEYDDLPVQAKVLFNKTSYTAYMVLGDAKYVTHLSRKNLDLLASQRHLKSGADDYLHGQNQLIISQNMAGKHQQALHCIERVLREAEANTGWNHEHYKAMLFDYTAFHQLEAYIGLGRNEDIRAVLPGLKEKIEVYGDKINPVNRQSKMYRISLGYFQLGEYATCLKLLSELDAGNKVQFRYDVKMSIKLLKLLCHYAIGNYEILELETRAYQHFLNGHGRMFLPEGLLLNFFQKVGETSSSTERTLRKELAESLAHLAKQSYADGHVLAYYDLPKWLNGRSVVS